TRKFRKFVLVRNETALNQDRRRSHVCDYKKLYGLSPAVDGAGPRHKCFLNETGETLAFGVRRIGRWPREKRQPRSESRARIELMRSVVSFHAARDRFVVFVEMNADKNAIVHPIPERCSIRQ